MDIIFYILIIFSMLLGYSDIQSGNFFRMIIGLFLLVGVPYLAVKKTSLFTSKRKGKKLYSKREILDIFLVGTVFIIISIYFFHEISVSQESVNHQDDWSGLAYGIYGFIAGIIGSAFYLKALVNSYGRKIR